MRRSTDKPCCCRDAEPRRYARDIAALVCVLVGLAVAQTSGAAGGATVAVSITNSRLGIVPATVTAGAVVFHVKNDSSRKVAFGLANTRTSPIYPGRAAVLKLELLAAGRYRFAVFGRGLGAAVSGLLTVRSASRPATTTTAPTTTDRSCSAPTASTVTVTLADGVYKLSAYSVPCGTVTFVVTNTGTGVHSFHVGAPGGDGPTLDPGQTVAMTVQLGKGTYQYTCGEPGCAELSEHGNVQGEFGEIAAT
jgi:plastocyanin